MPNSVPFVSFPDYNPKKWDTVPRCFASVLKCSIYAKMLNYDPDREGSGKNLEKRPIFPLKLRFQIGVGHQEWLMSNVELQNQGNGVISNY